MNREVMWTALAHSHHGGGVHGWQRPALAPADRQAVAVPCSVTRLHVTAIGPDGLGRYRVTMRPKRLAAVAPATPAPPAPSTADPRDRRISGLETALYHVIDVVVPKAAQGAAMRKEALAEAERIRSEQLVPR